VLALSARTQLSPGYTLPVAALVGCAVVVAGLWLSPRCGGGP
jgi:hypothetical protein